MNRTPIVLTAPDLMRLVGSMAAKAQAQRARFLKLRSGKARDTHIEAFAEVGAHLTELLCLAHGAGILVEIEEALRLALEGELRPVTSKFEVE